MELKQNYGYEQVLELVKQLPIEDEKKLSVEVEKDIFKKSQDSGNLKTRQFGDMKGLLVYMAEDFDASMDEFKDYM